MFEVKHQYGAILWDVFTTFPISWGWRQFGSLIFKTLMPGQEVFSKKKNFIWNILLYKPADKVESKR